MFQYLNEIALMKTYTYLVRGYTLDANKTSLKLTTTDNEQALDEVQKIYCFL